MLCVRGCALNGCAVRSFASDAARQMAAPSDGLIGREDFYEKVFAMIKIFILLTLNFLLLTLCFGQYNKNVSNVATTAAPFLQIGVGSRAIGMGGAFVATANDASAMYWNPAGLGNLNQIEAMFVHANWLADVTFDYAGVVFPLNQYGVLGVNLTMLNMGEMMVRTVDRPDGTGEYFDASDLAIGLAYGFNLTNRFAIGFNIKYISQKIWHESASGFALDIGTLYHTPFQGLRIGAALTNFGSDMQMRGNDLLVYHDIDPYQQGNNDKIFSELQTQSWPLPLNFQLGLALDVIKSEQHLLTVETDAVHPIDNKESLHIGAEYGYLDRYFIDAGYRSLFLPKSEEGITLGAGLLIRFLGNLQMRLQYAYADFGRLQNAQRFSINMKF